MDALTGGRLELSKYPRLSALVDRARRLPAICAAVAHPCDTASLAGALEAWALGMVEPILAGPRRSHEEDRRVRSHRAGQALKLIRKPAVPCREERLRGGRLSGSRA